MTYKSGTLVNVRILYIEDYVESIRLLEAIISEHTDYRLDIAQTPLEAMDLIATNTYDLIISDIDLPDMNGYALLKQIRSKVSLEGTSVMALSTRDSMEDIDKAREAGFDQYVTKPYTVQDILMVIDELLQKRPD